MTPTEQALIAASLDAALDAYARTVAERTRLPHGTAADNHTAATQDRLRAMINRLRQQMAAD